MVGIKKDSNGNKAIMVKPFNKPAFKILTNGNLPYIYSNVTSVEDYKDDAKAEKELKAWLKEYETKRVKVS